MTYLIVGLDRTTLAPWRENIQAREVTAATRLARARAQARGLNLVVAAVIGPNSNVLPDPGGERATTRNRRRPDSKPTRHASQFDSSKRLSRGRARRRTNSVKNRSTSLPLRTS
jgi:hypothetical protein